MGTTIVLLSGAINAGKTTVADELAERFDPGAHVEVDAFHGFLTNTPMREAIPINLENAVSVTANLVEREYDVVLTYPLSESDFEYALSELSALDADIYAITLSPPLEVALSDRGERDLNRWARDRVREMYEMGIHRPEFGVRIDTADQSPTETVDEVERRLRDDDVEPVVPAAETLDPVEHVNEWADPNEEWQDLSEWPDAD